MITVNWSRLLLGMAMFALINFVAERYMNVQVSNAMVAGLGVIAGKLCLRWQARQH